MPNTPGKRRREPNSSGTAAEQLVHALNQAVTSTARQTVISDVLLYLGYDETTDLCNNPDVKARLYQVVDAGLTSSLCLQLGFCQNHRIQTPNGIDAGTRDEIAVCHALELIFRCSDDPMRTRVLKELGSELFSILVGSVSSGNDAELDRLVLAIWYRCAAASAKSASHLFCCSGAMAAVMRVLRDSQTTDDTRTVALGIIKVISFFAEDRCIQLLEHPPGLLDTLCLQPFANRLNIKSAERLSAIFRNLSLTSSVRRILVEKPSVLSALVHLAAHESSTVKRNVLGVLDSMGMEARSCLAISCHGHGQLLNVLHQSLKSTVGVDDASRRKAARTLRFLSQHEQSAAILARLPPLMETLARCALEDPNRQVQAEAAEAYALCATFIRPPSATHEDVLRVLPKLALESSSHACPAIAKAIQRQLLHSTCSLQIQETIDLAVGMTRISLRENADLEATPETVMTIKHLSETEMPSLKKALASEETILRLLVVAARRKDLILHVVETILGLAREETNRQTLARHNGLLNTLVSYASTTFNNSAMPDKKTVKTAILHLVPFL